VHAVEASLATRSTSRTGARFDCFNVDLSSNELLRAGKRVPVQEQPFQILRLLLEAEGRVVTREQLRFALWPQDTFVDFEHGVNTAVKKLRQALEDSADRPKFIETLPKLGYRFITPVQWAAEIGANSSLAHVVPISPAARAWRTEVATQSRGWNPKLVVAVVVVGLLSAAVVLAKNKYLSYTRLEMLLSRVIRTAQKKTTTVTQRRLSTNPADTPLTSGVISPDGKYLAYTDESGFYLRVVEGGETHRIAMPKGFDPRPESWYPDSVNLVVSWFDNPSKSASSLWKISVLGGAPVKLADRGLSARVSKDGSKIAFLAGMWDCEEIWLMDADGSRPRKVMDGGVDCFGAVAWSPDDKQFAYVKTVIASDTERPGKQIGLYDLTSGRSQEIWSEARLGDELAWVNPGRLIYALEEADPNQGDFNLWSAQLDVAPGHLSSSPTRLTSDRTSASNFSVSADGKRMALRRSTSQGDIYLSEIEPGTKRLSKARRLSLNDRMDWPTSWTSDNNAVLFLSDRDGPTHIFKQLISETQPELLVAASDIVRAPRLTPDGLDVLYGVSAKPDQSSSNLRIMRIPVSGGPSQLVLEGSGITNYECARLPSTFCIYGQADSESGYYRFFSFDPSGIKKTEPLPFKMREQGGSHNWSLSPDGKYIVTPKSQNPYDEPVLRITNVSTETEKYISVPQMGLMIGLDWAADSRSVWVGGYMGRGASGARSGLLNVNIDGTVTVALKGLNPGVLFAVPSPDGHRLALFGNTESSNMWLLENF